MTIFGLDMIPTLKNWSITDHPKENPYLAPECRTRHLHGFVYNHPNYVDGHEITTSSIISVKGNLVTCVSRQYILDEPDPTFVEHCKKMGWHVPTKEHPIKV